MGGGFLYVVWRVVWLNRHGIIVLGIAGVGCIFIVQPLGGIGGDWPRRVGLGLKGGQAALPAARRGAAGCE
jgi:hypothetical protein